MSLNTLPISDYLPQINDKLSAGSNVVLQAEPGAGKSTALPLSLIGASWLSGQKILMLEPRRVAAKSIAHFLARQLGEPVGGRVGYQIKNDRKTSTDTMLEVVTEGVLTRRLQADPELTGVGLIIFDEFHERSIHADLSLLLALEVQQAVREDLKLLVMSATIDTTSLANYMGGAEIIECPGRNYPVSLQYTSSNARTPLAGRVVDALRKAVEENPCGDILVFLPGQADIRWCLSAAKQALGGELLVFLPLYGGLPLAQQEQALQADPNGSRRVIFSTNVAETSLTIEGIRCVIDSGLEKTLVYDAASAMARLETVYISKASAAQRQGRAGRTQAGACIRLWSEQNQRELRDYQGEEILSSDLSSLALELCSWGESDFDQINWLTPPPKHHFTVALDSLRALGLVDQKNRMTLLGQRAVGLPLSPPLAAMLLHAQSEAEKTVACELALLLSDRDIFRAQSGSDLLGRLLAIQDYKADRSQALKEHPIIKPQLDALMSGVKSLKRKLNITGGSRSRVDNEVLNSLSALQESVGRLLLHAYPSRLAKRRSAQCSRYQLAGGKGVFLSDGDSLFGSEWLLVADCDGQKTQGRIYSAMALPTSLIEELLAVTIPTESYEYDASLKRLTGRTVYRCGSLVLKSSPIANISIEKFQESLPQIIRQHGLTLLNWNQKCTDWLCRAQWLGQALDDFPELSPDSLLDSLDEWLLPYLSGVGSIAALKKVDVFELLVASLSWDEQQLLAAEAPSTYCTPSHKHVQIDYSGPQGPSVSVQLQEMFGQLDAPLVARGSVAIRFELLSPAKRPIQTTSDLGSFWKTSYFDVAKDMRGRYPKHRWPEQPLLEKAGKSIKPKR